MKKCKECGSHNWDIVIAYLRKEEGNWISLWQCHNCKRVVSATDEDIEGGGGKNIAKLYKL